MPSAPGHGVYGVRPGAAGGGSDLDPASCWGSRPPTTVSRASQCSCSCDPTDSSSPSTMRVPPRTPSSTSSTASWMPGPRPRPAGPVAFGPQSSSPFPGLWVLGEAEENSLHCLPRGHWGPHTGCRGKGHAPSPCIAQAISCCNLQLRTSHPHEPPASPTRGFPGPSRWCRLPPRPLSLGQLL